MPNWKKVITSGSNAHLNQITASTGIKGTLDTAAQTNITSVGTLNAGSITSGFGNIDIGSSTFTTTGNIFSTNLFQLNNGGVKMADQGTTTYRNVLTKDTNDLISIGNTTNALTIKGNTTTFTANITASGNISSSGNIIGELTGKGGAVTGITSLLATDIKIGEDAQTKIDFETANEIHFDVNNSELVNMTSGKVSVLGAISASGTITSSGFQLLGSGTAELEVDGHITASGNISSSGTITMLTASIGGGIFTSASLAAGGGGSTNAAGSDTQVQFNDGGTNFGGDAGLVFNKTSNLLTAGAITSTGDITANGNIAGDNSTNISGINDLTMLGDFEGRGNNSFGNAITDTSTFSGHITASGNISASGNIQATSMSLGSQHTPLNALSVTGNISASGTLTGGGLNVIGTTNLDAVDIDSTVQIDGNTTFGVDGTGVDVLFYGDTSGRNMRWNQSSDQLKLSDNVELRFGTHLSADSSDATIVHDGTNTTFTNIVGELQLIPDSGILRVSGSGDTKLVVEGNITASGNISGSASTRIDAQDLFLTRNLNTPMIESTSDLTIDVGGDLTLDAAGDDIFFKDNNTTRFTFNLDTAPSIDVAGSFEIDSSGDITLDAAGDDIFFKDAGSTRFTFNLDSTPEIDVTGDFTLDGSGDIKLDSATNVVDLVGNVTASGNISASGTITMLTASIGGGIFTSASLAAGGSGGSVSGDTFATDLRIGRDSDNHVDFTTDNQIDFDIDGSTAVTLIKTSDSGSIAVSGSVKIQPQTFVPSVSESKLYNKTTANGNVVDNLHFGTAGLTPAFAWVTLDDDGTFATSERIFGVGSAVTSTAYNMTVVQDTSTNGTRIFAELDGVYKVTNLATLQGGFGNATMKIKVDGSDVFSQIKFIHSSVDPVDRNTIYVGSVSSGSYITATVTGDGSDNTSYEVGSVLLVERLK